jgi:thiosulfate/3-mercaptopyruvate sulfurtransferase
MKIKRFIPVLLVLAGLWGCSDTEQQAVEIDQPQRPPRPLPDVLVNAEWLDEHKHDENVKLIDLSRSKLTYDSGHIPGAQYVDWQVDIIDLSLPEKYMVLPQQQLQQLLSELGVEKQSTIILYDDMTSRIATRMFWTLRYYNHDDIRILDGGREAWQRAGYAFETASAPTTSTQYVVDSINHDLLVEKAFIETRLDDTDNFTLVDGRPFDQYTGKLPGVVFHTGNEHQRKGHIYGAQSVPWIKNFNEDGTFKTYEELRLLYEPHHVTREKTIVTYCNEGLHAAPPWFVLSEILHYPDVRLYDASMAEWANDESTRMIQGARCM